MDHRQDRYLTLDGLRGVAAIAAAAYDLSALADVHPRHAGLIGHGYLAADFFFCLSGFVLARAYADGITADALSVRAFMITRLLRLLPLMALVAVAAFVTRMVLWNSGEPLSADTPAQLLADLPFGVLTLPKDVPFGGVAALFPLNPPGWFIFAEMVLNFIWAACLAKVRVEIVLVAAAIAFAVVMPQVVAFNTLDFAMTGAIGVWLPLARGLLSFLLGVAMWRLSLGKADQTSYFEILATVLWGVLWLPAGPSWVFDLVCVTLLFPMLILFAAEAETLTTGAPVLAFLGAIAFPLFALHAPLIAVLATFASSSPELLSPAVMAFELGVGVACAWGVHTYIELPLRLKLSRVRLPGGERGTW